MLHPAYGGVVGLIHTQTLQKIFRYKTIVINYQRHTIHLSIYYKTFYKVFIYSVYKTNGQFQKSIFKKMIVEVKTQVGYDKKQLELGRWKIILVKIINNDW